MLLELWDPRRAGETVCRELSVAVRIPIRVDVGSKFIRVDVGSKFIGVEVGSEFIRVDVGSKFIRVDVGSKFAATLGI